MTLAAKYLFFVVASKRIFFGLSEAVGMVFIYKMKWESGIIKIISFQLFFFLCLISSVLLLKKDIENEKINFVNIARLI